MPRTIEIPDSVTEFIRNRKMPDTGNPRAIGRWLSRRFANSVSVASDLADCFEPEEIESLAELLAIAAGGKFIPESE